MPGGCSLMDGADLNVLRDVEQWCLEGRGVVLYTLVQTWGSAPRSPGAMLALRDDGRVSGSVSGGCIEDDLIARLNDGRLHAHPDLAVDWVTYGVSQDEAARFGLPCGGTLRLLEEKIRDASWVSELVQRCDQHELVTRSVDLATGAVSLAASTPGQTLQVEEGCVKFVHGPRWRLLLIGAGQLSRYVADLAHTLEFEVLICDPRLEFTQGWEVPYVHFVPGMPDDAVLAIEPDERTAIVALTHDPRLDDMALLTALDSRAFYVGALGSRVNSQKRRQNLLQLGVSDPSIQRLHGPIGLPIGSHTPAEIALSLMAQIVAIKNCAA